MSRNKNRRPARMMKLKAGITKDNVLMTMHYAYVNYVEGLELNSPNRLSIKSIRPDYFKNIRIEYRDDDKGTIVVHTYKQLHTVLQSVTTCDYKCLVELIKNSPTDEYGVKNVYWKEFFIKIWTQTNPIRGGYDASY